MTTFADAIAAIEEAAYLAVTNRRQYAVTDKRGLYRVMAVSRVTNQLVLEICSP